MHLCESSAHVSDGDGLDANSGSYTEIKYCAQRQSISSPNYNTFFTEFNVKRSEADELYNLLFAIN